jgi:hypothetical protein
METPGAVPGSGRTVSDFGRSDGANATSSDGLSSPKNFRAQAAASLACWPISPVLGTAATQAGVGSNVGTAYIVSAANDVLTQMPDWHNIAYRFPVGEMTSRYLYAVSATRLRLSVLAPWQSVERRQLYPGTFGPFDLIQAEVEHDFALRVPFAGPVLGEKRTSIGAGGISLGGENLYTTTIRAAAVLSNEGEQEYPPGIPGR